MGEHIGYNILFSASISALFGITLFVGQLFGFLSGTYISGFILSIFSIAIPCVCLWVAAPRRGVELQNH